MSWIHNLEDSIHPASIHKGQKYFRSGRVRLNKGSADHVEATVHGTDAYEVEIYLDVPMETVVAGCTCPYYDEFNICKHIWATLLAAESRGHLKEVAHMQSPSIETELEHESDDEGEDESHDADFTYAQNRYRRSTPQQKAPPIAPWKQRISQLRIGTPRLNSDRPEGARQIVYIADAAGSLSSGELVIQAAACRLKKDGQWGKPALQETSIRQISKLESCDQKLLALLHGSRDYYGMNNLDGVRSIYRIAAGAQDVLIPLLCETGRFFLKTANPDDPLLPLKWDAGTPWRFRIEMQRNDDNVAYTLKGILCRDEAQISLATPVLLVPGLVFFQDAVARSDDGDAFQWIQMLRKSGDLQIPIDHKREFLDEIAQFSVLPPIDLPPELSIENRALRNPPELKIRPLSDSWRAQQRLAVSVTFDYDGVKIDQKNGAAVIHDPNRDLLFRRDKAAELAHLNRLAELGFQPTAYWQEHPWELAASRLSAAVLSLVSEAWRVDAEGKLYRRPTGFQMKVASGVDWFELHGHAEFEGRTVDMPQLLKAIARGDRSVRLDDGTYGLVPEEWLKRYHLLASLGKSVDGQARFERHQAGFLDALLAEQPDVTFDEGFARVRQEMATFAGIQDTDAAESFHGSLRNYQKEGLGWLHFLRRFKFGGCLADDMGLGKTVQILALLDSLDRSCPCLVVAPRSLIFNWKQEAERFTPRLRVLDYTGSERANYWAEIQNYNIILTTYGTLRRDAARLKDIRFDTVVLDEAQAIKNASTESAKAVRLLKSDHRIALTGTPVENRIGDLWSLFEFLNPGLLGTASVFRTQVSRKNGTSADPGATPIENSLHILSKALRPFLLRRTKEQVARELPAKTEQTIYCELESEQRRLYNELRTHYRDALLGRIDKVGIGKSRMQILEALLRLRQAACHPGLLDEKRNDESSAKLDALIPQIQELIDERHKTLVFSQFTSFLAILRKRLDKEGIIYEYLDGRTRDREARVRRFQEDQQCPLFLISLKAGGLGLNLTAADYVFLLDPWWNPAIEAQAIDRTHRIGQTRNVFAYRLIARDTIEEKILELQKTKRELADAIITEDNSIIAGLNRESLELLLT